MDHNQGSLILAEKWIKFSKFVWIASSPGIIILASALPNQVQQKKQGILVRSKEHSPDHSEA